MNQTEIDPEVFENLSLMFPNAPPHVISTYLQLYTFDDAVYTLQLFYPNTTSEQEKQTIADNQNDSEDHSVTISQDEIDEGISKILDEFPDFDDEYCLILLEDSNYDVEKAKKEARALIQYQQELHESRQKALFESLKNEFPNLNDQIIGNAIEFACNDYEKAKSIILENIHMEQVAKSTKKKQKKTIVDGNGQAIPQCTSKKQKKNKRRSEFIQLNPKREEKETKTFESTTESIENQSNASIQFSNEMNSLNNNESDASNQFHNESNASNQFHNEANASNQSHNQTDSTLNDNDSVNDSNNSQIKLIDTQSQNQSKKMTIINEEEEIEDEEKEFYRKMLSKSSSSKFKVNKTTRMPGRFLQQPDLTVIEINLHGMNADDVSEQVIRTLKDAKNSNVRSIRFVTGAGHHSKNNIPVLRPLVFSICKKMGYKPTLSPDRGCVIVNVK